MRGRERECVIQRECVCDRERESVCYRERVIYSIYKERERVW